MEHPSGFACRGTVGAPHDGDDAGRQLFGSKGGGQAVVRSREQQFHPGGGVADGDGDERRPRVSNQCEDLPLVGSDGDIDDGDIGTQRRQRVPELVDGVDGDNAHPVPAAKRPRGVAAGSRGARPVGRTSGRPTPIAPIRGILGWIRSSGKWPTLPAARHQMSGVRPRTGQPARAFTVEGRWTAAKVQCVGVREDHFV